MDDVLAKATPEHLGKLQNYFSDVGGDTFVIRNLPSQLTGASLARYSRAKTGMQLTIVNEFLDEDFNPNKQLGDEMLHRVLIQYGDDSVGELEGGHVGIEDISQLLTKYIEDRRIGGSPIEQSTRYVMYDQKDKNGKWRYLRPKEVEQAGLLKEYEAANDMAFTVYSEGIKRLVEHFKTTVVSRNTFPIKVRRDGKEVDACESELISDEERRAFKNAYGFTVRCAALDVGRCVLPSSTLTHLGIYGNGRFFTNLISFLKSSDLLEAKERGAKLEKELNTVIPTFIKRNQENPRYSQINERMFGLSKELFDGIVPEAQRVTLVDRAPLLDEVTAACVYPYAKISLSQILAEVKQMPHDRKMEILAVYNGERTTRRDRTGRGLEGGYPITFDLLGGFAEYRDLERHRMLTQQRQELSVDFGFSMPPEMQTVGLEQDVKEVVSTMEDLNSTLKRAGLRESAQYATLFNHRLRFSLGMNLREAQHLFELRTQKAGHFSYRGMVQEMAKQLTAREPWSEQFYAFVDYSDPDNKISRAAEQGRIAGKNIARSIDGEKDLL
jgi:thymidylate synthase ThyX